MLNTRSSIPTWCENNGLNTVITKYMESDGTTLKAQYVTADNGIGHDHNVAMSLHKWHSDNEVVLQHLTMRVSNNGTDL
eukprot:2465061-Amphidinium_carterae.1